MAFVFLIFLSPEPTLVEIYIFPWNLLNFLTIPVTSHPNHGTPHHEVCVLAF